MAWKEPRGKAGLYTVYWRCKLPRELCRRCRTRKSRVHSQPTGTADETIAEWHRVNAEAQHEPGRRDSAERVTTDAGEALVRFLRAPCGPGSRDYA